MACRHSKANPRRLWHAIDHYTGKVWAYVFGRRQDDVFLKLQQLLAPLVSRAISRTAGGLRAASGGRAAHDREGTHAEDREQVH